MSRYGVIVVIGQWKYQTFLLLVDILPQLKQGDSSDETLMSERENVQGGVYVAVVSDSTLTTCPFSYSKSCSTFRTAGRDGPAARASLGGVALVDYLKDDTGLMALVFQHRL